MPDAPTLTDLPEDLTGLTGDELAKIEADAVAAADAIIAKDAADLTDADEAEAERLLSTVETVRAESTRRVEAAEARASKVADLRTRIHAEDETPEGDAPEGEESESAEGDAAEPESPAEGDAPAEVGESIAASGAAKPTSIARVAARTKPRGLPDAPKSVAPKATLLAAAGHETDVAEIAKAAIRAAQSFPTGSRGGRQTVPLARIERPEIDGLVASASMSESAMREVLDRAADESRLPGGSLLASGGWCAPSENLYDLAAGLETLDGLVSIPEISVTRGGVNFTVGPDFSNLFGGAGFIHTEANDIAGDSKACFTVPCPSFSEVRLEAIGVCIIAGILGQKAYPENVERWISGTMAAHAHRVNGVTLDDMSDGSTAVTIVAPGTGAASSVLSAVSLQVADMKNRHRMGFGAVLELVLPEWSRELFRSDLAKFHGVSPDDAFKITDAQINGWFAERKVAVQWVVDWQDNFSVDVASGIGGPTPATTWPANLKFLLYPAGTFVRGGGNIINIEALYDSTLLETNDYTALFTEDSHLTAKRGFESRVVTVPVCASGEQAPAATMHACPIV